MSVLFVIGWVSTPMAIFGMIKTHAVIDYLSVVTACYFGHIIATVNDIDQLMFGAKS